MLHQMDMAEVNVEFPINSMGQFVLDLVDNTIVDKSTEHRIGTGTALTK